MIKNARSATTASIKNKFLLIWNIHCNNLLQENMLLGRDLRLNFIAADEGKKIFKIVNAFLISERS